MPELEDKLPDLVNPPSSFSYPETANLEYTTGLRDLVEHRVQDYVVEAHRQINLAIEMAFEKAGYPIPEQDTKAWLEKHALVVRSPKQEQYWLITETGEKIHLLTVGRPNIKVKDIPDRQYYIHLEVDFQ